MTPPYQRSGMLKYLIFGNTEDVIHTEPRGQEPVPRASQGPRLMFFTLILPVAAAKITAVSLYQFHLAFPPFFKLPASFRGKRNLPPPHAVARSGVTDIPPFFGSVQSQDQSRSRWMRPSGEALRDRSLADARLNLTMRC